MGILAELTSGRRKLRLRVRKKLKIGNCEDDYIFSLVEHLLTGRVSYLIAHFIIARLKDLMLRKKCDIFIIVLPFSCLLCRLRLHQVLYVFYHKCMDFSVLLNQIITKSQLNTYIV